MANNSSRDESSEVSELDEAPLIEMRETITATQAEPLPDNSAELDLLRRSVFDAIANLSELSADLRGESRLLNELLDTTQTMGSHPLDAVSALPTGDPVLSHPVRWEFISTFLSGQERLCIKLLPKTIRDFVSRQKNRLVLLSYPDVVDEMASQLGMVRGQQHDPDEFRQFVSRNYLRGSEIDDYQEVTIGLELSIHALKQLEVRIRERQAAPAAEYSKPNPKQHFRFAFGKNGKAIPPSTFRRIIKRGEIRIKELTRQTIQVAVEDLPDDYAKKT